MLWDDEIPSELLADPITTNDFRISTPLAFRVGLLMDLTVHCALHGFSDASTATFAAAVYLRIVDSLITVSLLAKSKVAYLKTISVSRLKLSAALLLAHLTHFVLR